MYKVPPRLVFGI